MLPATLWLLLNAPKPTLNGNPVLATPLLKVLSSLTTLRVRRFHILPLLCSFIGTKPSQLAKWPSRGKALRFTPTWFLAQSKEKSRKVRAAADGDDDVLAVSIQLKIDIRRRD
jgi:hypothetical protein